MALHGAITNAFVYVGGHDFTGDSNQLTLSTEGETRDTTNFRSGGWREHIIGLKTSTLNLAGFWQSAAADAVDPETFNNLGAGGRAVTCGVNEVEGQPAMMLQALQANYTVGGAIGEVAPFNLNGVCSDGQGVVRGVLLKEQGAVSATGAIGTAVELGAASATQYRYATLHLLGTAATTITVVLESDSDNTFASATTVGTFGPLTTAGGTWLTRVAGASTDTWYRFRVTAITGTWTVSGAAGIQ
jgi:hypothetical protein